MLIPWLTENLLISSVQFSPRIDCFSLRHHDDVDRWMSLARKFGRSALVVWENISNSEKQYFRILQSSFETFPIRYNVHRISQCEDRLAEGRKVILAQLTVIDIVYRTRFKNTFSRFFSAL